MELESVAGGTIGIVYKHGKVIHKVVNEFRTVAERCIVIVASQETY